MASTVTQFNVSNNEAISSVSDKVSRKKRKFRADIPQSDGTKNDSLLENYFPRQFSVEKPEGIPSHCENGVCKVCGDGDPVSLELELGLPGTGKEESSLYIPETTDWDESAESELQELVLSIMDATFKSAIKTIVECGYSEKVVMKAMMRPGLCYGSKDTLSNIVDNSLAFLRTSQDLDRSIKYCFKDLDELQDYLLAEFVCALQAVRPIFSPAEALWYLLVFDIDVSLACFVISGQYKLIEDGHADEISPNSTQNRLNTDSKRLDLNLLASSTDARSELPGSVVDLNSKETETSAGPDPKDSKRGEMRFPINVVDQSVAAPGTPQKFCAGGKLCSSRKATLKNASNLEQKWKHVDKGWRKRGHKGAHKTGKVLSWNSVRRTNRTGLPSSAVTCSATSSAAEVERYFSAGAKKEPTQASVTSHSDVNNCKYNESPVEDIKGRPGTGGLDAEIIFQLTTRSQMWKNDLKEWTEWANTKVLQATRRLLKHKPELNKLRQEKVETELLEQEKQALKENITKKLSELESAAYKASGKVKIANSAIRRLEMENSTLMQDMEAAKFLAAKSAANCQEAFKKERERLTTVQTCTRQKGFFRDDLNAEKLKHAQAQQELRKAAGSLSRLEAKWESEAKAKGELVLQATKVREEIEQLKASGKSKEETINSKAEITLQKYKDDVQELEREISKLRLKSDSSKIAALRRGIDESHLTGLGKSPSHRKPQNLVISKNTQVSHKTNSSNSFVMRHRECVMCLEEEMSVVFLPCAHQVLCTKCNAQHEKNGMKDCPSCRSTILRRIPVRYAMR